MILAPLQPLSILSHLPRNPSADIHSVTRTPHPSNRYPFCHTIPATPSLYPICHTIPAPPHPISILSHDSHIPLSRYPFCHTIPAPLQPIYILSHYPRTPPPADIHSVTRSPHPLADTYSVTQSPQPSSSCGTSATGFANGWTESQNYVE